ncbi:MAG: hypothetical protein IIX09_02165, partial [Clostridia bacterium]|nr:hypothetical protein [Clostridia bacterium]
MKKFIKYALFVLMALSIAVACIACNGAGGTGGTNNNPDAGAAPEKIEGQLPELDKEIYAPYGELPDLDGVVIDGAIDDELWEGRKWYSQYSTTNRAGMRCTTVFSDKGLYIAAESSDRSIYWTLRNHFDQNTHLVFRIVTGVNNVVQFQVDANN